MSFILKALKKLEDEKAIRSNPADLNSAILTGDAAGAPRGRRSTGWAVIFLVFVAGSTITYFLTARGTTDHTRSPKQLEASPQLKSPAPVPAAVPAPSPARENDAAGGERIPSPPVAAPGSVPTPPVAAKAADHAPPARPRSLPGPLVPAPPGLALAGIAVHDNPAESVAIVNGTIMRKGMTTEGGARVEEILADRVRFSGSGGTFEVHLQR